MTTPGPEPATEDTGRALLLDNDLFFVAKITQILRHAGYTTRVARQPSDFARLLTETRPDVVLINTAARGLDWRAGIAAARGAGVPVIAFGAHVDIATQQAARAAGADRVIANSKLAGDLPVIVARTVRRTAPLAPREAATEEDISISEAISGPSADDA